MRFDEGKIVIEIELGNAEMSRPADVANLLRELANEMGLMVRLHEDDQYDAGSIRRKFRDVNGNTVAFWKHVT